ncbi:hypothetical protein IGI37_001522 [Enterococcus sp. AZ194]|uniref:transposase n=1 Tax=Enterococcus sp. AZ194 TaxID=2774629 RepID=UPI003F23D765
MTIIQQPTLFELDILASLDVKERHAEIFSPIDFLKLTSLFKKDTAVGTPITVNYASTIRAVLTRFLEKIPTMNALIQRLKEDAAFKLSLGFLYAEEVPSKSTFSRVLTVLSENITLLEGLNQELLQMINQEVLSWAIFNFI